MMITTLPVDNWNEKFADLFLLAIKKVLVAKGKCSIYLTGGKSAASVYQALAANPDFLRLSCIEIYLSDERCTIPNSLDSNYFSIMQTLFAAGLAEGFLFHQMHKSSESPAESLHRCCKEFPNYFDIGLISVAKDGHIASIFPECKQLYETDNSVALTVSNKHPFERLTITPKTIENTACIFVLAVGKEKDWIINRLLSTSGLDKKIPATLLRGREWIAA